MMDSALQDLSKALAQQTQFINAIGCACQTNPPELSQELVRDLFKKA